MLAIRLLLQSRTSALESAVHSSATDKSANAQGTTEGGRRRGEGGM